LISTNFMRHVTFIMDHHFTRIYSIIITMTPFFRRPKIYPKMIFLNDELYISVKLRDLEIRVTKLKLRSLEILEHATLEKNDLTFRHLQIISKNFQELQLIRIFNLTLKFYFQIDWSCWKFLIGIIADNWIIFKCLNFKAIKEQFPDELHALQFPKT